MGKSGCEMIPVPCPGAEDNNTCQYTLDNGTLTISGTTIPERAFYASPERDFYASSWSEVLKTVIIDNSVEVIESRAFMGCSNLESVIVGAGVHTIHDQAFYECDKLSYFCYSGSSTRDVSKSLFEGLPLETVTVTSRYQKGTFGGRPAVKGDDTCQAPCLLASCVACDSSDPSKCATCEDSLYPNGDGACVCSAEHCTACGTEAGVCDDCVTGSYRDTEDENKCKQCNSECATCENGDSCLTCARGYYNAGDETGVSCVACAIAHCDVCTSESCTKCVSGYTGDACDKCADGYFNDTGECKKCFLNCATCSGADKCDTCREGYTGDVCDACASGYHEVGEACVKDVASSTSETIEPPMSSEAPTGLGAGAVAGVVISVLVVAGVVVVAVYCAVTGGSKRGKIDPDMYEEDTEFVTMSVL